MLKPPALYTVVHFSTQPEPFLSLFMNAETTKRIPQEVCIVEAKSGHV